MKYPKILVFAAIVLSLFFLGSCKLFERTPAVEENPVIFPSPPDTARIQYLMSISSSRDIKKKQSKFSKFVTGEDKPLTIAKPFGVEIRYGKMYICDVGIKGIEIIDLEKKTFVYFIPDGKGKLIIPVNCYVDEKGYLYVSDSGRREIVIFDNHLKFVRSFGEDDSFQPLDVFVSDNKIWVADLKGHKIKVYQNDSTNKLLLSFPDVQPKEEGFLYQPKNLFVTDDFVYVSDLGGFRVSIFSKTGDYIESVGKQGKGPGHFSSPKGIAVDNDENLYVIDAAFGNAQIFNRNRQLLLFFGGPFQGKGYMYLPAGITVDYDNLNYFEQFVDPEYDLEYLIIVTNQYGPYKLNVYGRVQHKDNK